MSEVIQILAALGKGESQETDKLLPLAYDEPRGLAACQLTNHQSGQTLQAIALVHETCLRLIGEGDPHWHDRRHFFFEPTQSKTIQQSSISLSLVEGRWAGAQAWRSR